MARYGTAVDRLSFYAPYKVDETLWEGVLAQIKVAAAK